MQPNVFIHKSPSIVCGRLLLTPLMNSLYEVVVAVTDADGVVGKSKDDPIHTGTWHLRSRFIPIPSVVSHDSWGSLYTLAHTN